jgi:LuxR family transcriptional regulator, maltose regulon positive regulatory protein
MDGAEESSMHSEPVGTAAPSGVATSTADRLTARERRVLEFVALGYTNEQIAAELAFSLSTIKADIGSILRKLGARNRAGAVALASHLGVLGPKFA